MDVLVQGLPLELQSQILLYALKSPHTDLEVGYLRSLLGSYMYNKLMHYREITIEDGHVVKISMLPLAFDTRQTLTVNIEVFRLFPYLKYLNLNNTRVYGDISVIRLMPNLSKFFLGKTKVSGDIHTLQSLPQLTHCYVHHTDITGHMQRFFDFRKDNGLNYCLMILYNGDNRD